MEHIQNPVSEAVQEEVTHIALTKLRKTIARRTVESLQTMAQMTTSAEMDATNLFALRARLAADEEKLGTRITVTDLIARAVVKALRQFPYANSSMTEDEILLYPYVNLSVAIATPAGLISPVIYHAEKMSLAEISLAIKDLTARAKTKKLTYDDMSGGTFTISSLGNNSSGGAATPIINPPQAGIVQFGAAIRKPVVIDEEIVIRSMMVNNFTFDHRILDGATIRDFIRTVKGYIEHPDTILD